MVTGIHVPETIVRQRVMVAGTCKKVYTKRQIRRRKKAVKREQVKTQFPKTQP